MNVTTYLRSPFNTIENIATYNRVRTVIKIKLMTIATYPREPGVQKMKSASWYHNKHKQRRSVSLPGVEWKVNVTR